jgi:hypothetical protein
MIVHVDKLKPNYGGHPQNWVTSVDRSVTDDGGPAEEDAVDQHLSDRDTVHPNASITPTPKWVAKQPAVVFVQEDKFGLSGDEIEGVDRLPKRVITRPKRFEDYLMTNQINFRFDETLNVGVERIQRRWD